MHLYELKDSMGRMTMELGIFKSEENAKNAVKNVIVPPRSAFLTKVTDEGHIKVAIIKGGN